ncbi:MAG: type VI secretion system lipoprotein TssJ [Ketobacteraceae bacterium]|nr:type VI secretion system lipoprotein TssJ [Ketobacteraceae bacterium]
MKKLTLITVCALLLSGCQWMLSDVTKVDLRLIAKGDLNLDDNGRPSPLVVRIIELRSAQSFEAAEFFSLFQAEEETLGSDWVASEEIELKPGDIRDLKIALQPDSQLIGVVGAYRRLDDANWRLVMPFALHEKNQQTLIFSSRGIAMATR